MRLDPRRLMVHAVLRQMVRKERFDTVADLVEARTARPLSPAPPSGRAARDVDIVAEESEGITAYRLTPTAGASTGHLVYLHGGAYVGEIVAPQWTFVLALVRATGVTCVVPIYGLAPHETAARTVEQSAAIIGAAIAEHGDVSVLGDSAGGGLAVAATQSLMASGSPLPSQLLLVAPWLDVTMTHPDQSAIEPHDIMLRRDYLADAGRLYAGDLDPTDWRVSPLHGELAGLPPLHVFAGTHDMLVTDARQLADRVRAAGGHVSYVEAPQMQHVYVIFPLIPEAREARRKIRAFLT